MHSLGVREKIATACIALLLVAAVALIIPMDMARAGYVRWVDYPSNPVYDPAVGRAYYPCVIYDESQFSGHGDAYYYKMWYGDTDASRWEWVVYSNDGITWENPEEITGIVADGYHAKVIYVPGGYGAGPYYYRIWYWDQPITYTINDMRTADSVDGVSWVNDQVITQDSTYPLVTGSSSDWNYGTYGPVEVFYNPSADNSGTDPFDYSYAMYFDAATGASETIALAYSGDGVAWTRYHESPYANSPLIDHGAAGAWDSGYTTFGTVIRESSSVWHLWYSGGQSQPGDGIGYASSTDGINWTKSADNPIYSKNDGITWRNSRTYTPSVIYSPDRFDGHGSDAVFRMWYTGRSSGGNFAIGTAERSSIIPVGPGEHFTTIQAAIDGAYDGDTIQVEAGTYNESLQIDRQLMVESVSGAASTIIDAPDGEPYVVVLEDSNITFDGFTVTNPEYTGASDASGIVLTWDPSYSGVHIANCVVHDIGTLDRSPVVFGTAGINLGQCHDVEVDHCEVYNIGNGNVGDTWAQGFSIWGNDAATQATNVYIHDCNIHDVSSPNAKDSAIGIQGNVAGITIENNTMTDTGEYGVDTWDIWGGEYSPTSITGNNISGATVAGVKMLYPGGNNITGNSFDQCGTGILVASTGGASSLRYNDFTNCTAYGIDNQSSGSMDAAWCYWSSPHGPSYGRIVYGEGFSGELSWRPYLNAPYSGTPPAIPISVTTASPLPTATTQSYYSTTLAASGGTSPYTWFIYAGTLPAGLALSSDGVLSGTPTAGGDYTFSIEGADGTQADFKEFTLHVSVSSFTVNASVAGGHGQVDPASQNVDLGGTASIDIVPDPGYNIASITDNGAAVPVNDPYVIENVQADHDVVVTFTSLDFTLEKTAQPPGEIVRGQVLLYTLRARNNDTLAVTGCALRDTVPAFTSYVTHTTTLNGTTVPDIGGGSPLASGMAVNSPGEAAGVIAPGEEALVTFTVQVGSDLPLGGSVRNTAQAWADGMGTIEASCENHASPDLPATWYFAEGSTQPGFDEYILLSNMGESDMDVTITYVTEGGAETEAHQLVPAHSRQTVYVNAEMPGEAGVAAIVEGKQGLICERSMYYQHNGFVGGDDVMGTNAPGIDLFFAEGFTGTAQNPFEEWILVLNPNPGATTLTIDYLFPGGDTLRREYVVPNRQRFTISVDQEVGEGREVSARVRSELPVVAERAMYFDYLGKWLGGHNGTAATGAYNDWYLAEGFTGQEDSQFDEWILVANENSVPAMVDVTYMFSGGGKKTVQHAAAPHGRLTISADADVGQGQAVSARIRCDVPVVVERAMYFDYRNKWTGGHNSLAAPSPASQLFFAEGFTGDAASQFETWLLIQNTSSEAKTAVIEYILSSGDIISRELALPPDSRSTVYVNDVLGEDPLEFSMRVTCKDGSAVLLAERAMYFSYTGSFGFSQGGHDVMGY